MLQLRRVRLESIGHPNARFAPLQLRLTDDEDRPTHTVLWLRNGGGKSSLLNLVFAVVRPHRREFLGSNDDGKDRRLADYVLDGDTGHVCIEWGRPGDRMPSLVTGMTLEWRDRTRVTDESRLRRLWYAFVPSDHREPGLLDVEPTLTFDTLPMTEDGRRLPLTRFRDRLRTLALTDPSLRLVTPSSQAEWRRELEQHDLDPEVLRYQLQMNREEGGASELFKRRCRTASDFVDMLLELAVADERTDRVADVYTRYADELARRPDVERNRDFLAGSLERLAPVVDAATTHAAADHELRTALADAAATAAAMRAAARDTRARSAGSDARAADHLGAAEVHAAREAEARDLAVAAQRLAAEHDVADAQRRYDEAGADLAAAQTHLAVANLLEPLARARQLDDELATVDRQRSTGRSDLAVELVRARAELARRLRADLAASSAAADGERARAATRHREAAQASLEAQHATAERGGVEQALATAEEQQQARRSRYEDLHARGILPDGDVGTGLSRARAELDVAQRASADRRQRIAALDADIRAAYARLSAVDAQLGEARARAGACTHEQAQMHAAATALAGDQRLVQLAETETIDLWHTGAMLAERLDALVGDADRALADEAVTAAADRAALVALQTDGLLPVRGAVTDLIALLASRGVAARPGWRYLAEEVTAPQRVRLLAAAPAIADGVAVADGAALAAARTVIEDLAGPLSSVVVVGVPPHADAAVVDGATVLAPVDPALYDRRSAERSRSRLHARLADTDQRRSAMLSARDRDATLADRLRQLLRTYPPPRRTQIDDDAELARRDTERMRAERDAVTAETERLQEGRTAEADADDGAAQVRRLSTAVAELTALADDPFDDRRRDELTRRVRQADDRADAATRRVDELRRVAADHLVAAQRHADECDRIRDELAELVAEAGGGDAAPDADTGPTAAAEILRRRVHTLQAGVATERPGHALDERHRLLMERRTESARQLADADDDTVATAATLLGSAAGRSARARAEITRAAEQRRDAALEARAEAAERVRAARRALDLHPAADAGTTTAPDDLASAAAARARADALLADAADAQRAAAARRAQAADAQRESAEHRRLAERYEHLAELLTIELRARPARAPRASAADGVDVAADPEQARAKIAALRGRIEDRAARADRAGRTLAAVAADVRRFVSSDRFAALDGPIRSRLTGDPVGVAADDPGLLEQLRIRLAQCEQKLQELAAHRRLLVREIAADTQRGLWLLRQADHVSALPAGLGQWSEQRFLHIRFAAPAVDDELMERLEAMVDQLVDEGIRPAGVPLLQRATHAAAGRQGFDVRILKPNPALRPERVPVTELATFSGGEQLTAAILLYCTLARLRAQSRQTRTAAGVLTLDNPIGKSSNVTLLQLQRRVADAMGVQLVYTTAVDDREAVGVLPHWIRLRNERRDARSGNLHVEAEPHSDGDDHSLVAATHLWRRGDAIEPVPGGR